MLARKWKKYRPSVYGDNDEHTVFRIALRGEVENPNGRYWAAVRRDGTFVESADLNLPYEGIHRFKTLRDAKDYLEVFDDKKLDYIGFCPEAEEPES